MNYKFFNRVFFAGFIPIAASVIATSLWLEPFDGDMTRVSGNSENAFGWTIPQEQFPQNFSRYTVNGNANPPEDTEIVVFGDSFSHIGSDGLSHRYGWQNYLASATNKSIFTYHINHTDIFTWLDQLEPDNKIQYLIYEQVERSMPNHRDFANKCNDSARDAVQPTLPNIAVIAQSNDTTELTRKYASLLNLDDSVHWLKTKLSSKTRAKTLPLSKSGIFSSNNQSDILVFYGDLLVKNVRLSETDKKGIVCFFHILHDKVENQHGMKLVVGIAPDKTTVYRSYIKNLPAETLIEQEESVFALLENQQPPLFRYDQYFRNLVDEGIKDVYLPNDSHWGSNGSRHFASIIKAQMCDK